jgi:adenylate cyclase
LSLPSAERALSLDPNLAEAHAIKAWYLLEDGKPADAEHEVSTALNLDPESWEVNKVAAKVLFLQGRLQEAADCYEKAAELMDLDYHSACMMECCYRGLANPDRRRQAAELGFERVEKALEINPRDASGIAAGAASLAVLGEVARAREWAERALSLEPENHILRYNVACIYALELDDPERALDLIEISLAHLGRDHIRHARADPDIASLRGHPRFKRMIEEAKARLEVEELEQTVLEEKMAPRA